MIFPYQHELETLKPLVREAGNRVLELSRTGFHVHRKSDRSPVTTADLEVNRYLKEQLLQIYPDDGWLSEEEPDDHTRLTKSRVWIVDPLDGTKYFIAGVPQFAISIALVENAEPVVAVIFNPATNEFFSAVQRQGAFLDGSPVHVRTETPHSITLLVNPPALHRGLFRNMDSAVTCQPMGSIAYTLALIASGRADGTINVARQNEWDLAAGTLLVHEAGGQVMDRYGHPLRFNQRTPFVRGVIATRPDLASRLLDLAKRLFSK
ncbi:MAG: 3'(2'),5'-bisphosphate nucleotidase CysQ [Nitrospirae bacterium]|nr:MAG: 3'(2'),5'-bisphosphate nucleotidase CysQ [Nitrospirota bacterium]